MMWIETVRAVIDREKVSLAEFILLDEIRAGFPMTPERAVALALKTLGPAETGEADYRRTLDECLQKQWLIVVPASQSAAGPEQDAGTLRLGAEGALIIEKIHSALNQR